MSAILITNGLISGHVFVYVVISRAPPLLLASNHTYCKCIPRERYAKWNDFTIHRHYGSSPWTYITSRCCLFDKGQTLRTQPDIYRLVSLWWAFDENDFQTCSIYCSSNFSVTWHDKWKNEFSFHFVFIGYWNDHLDDWG